MARPHSLGSKAPNAPARVAEVEQFAPEMILRDLSDPTFPAQPPRLTQKPAVAMFADISGYTKLSEEFAQLGPLGAENLAFWLNRCAAWRRRARAARAAWVVALGPRRPAAAALRRRAVSVDKIPARSRSYFEMLVRIVNRHGGDVFKFAGDAMLILWPVEPDDGGIGGTARRAAQAGLAIQVGRAGGRRRGAGAPRCAQGGRRATQAELHDAHLAAKARAAAAGRWRGRRIQIQNGR